jgi:calcineurin-like phosphoesterase family protein
MNEQVIKLKAEGLTRRQIAEKLGMSFRAVKEALYAKNLPQGTQIAPEERNRVDYWKSLAEERGRELVKAQKNQTAIDVLVEQAVELAPKSYQTPTGSAILARKVGKNGSPQSALLVFSDTHVGKVVKPDQTLGFGGYNFDIFLRRLKRLERSVTSILQDHTTTNVPEIVVAMLGDMLDGNLNHAAEAGQHNTLFSQFYSAGHAIAQFFQRISHLAPLRIVTAVGNHTRWGTQHKMPTENRYSNLDQFLYAYVAALLRDNKRISFALDRQPFALFDVQGYAFYGGHGDHLKGGDKALGIPNHSVGRSVSSTVQMFATANRRPPNYYLFGHLHRPITLPHALGEVIINGGFPGIDGYALMSGFVPSFPSQKLFLVHPKFGRSACYDLRLDLGDAQPHDFTLPGEFTAQ